MPSAASRVETLRAVVARARGQYDLLERQLGEVTEAEAKLRQQAETAMKAALLLRALGARQRDVLKGLVEPLCTDALCDLFGPDSEFSLDFTQTDSGRYRATIRTKSDGFSGPPRDTDGGSVCEILSVVLRIAFLMIHHPRMSPVLVLDEPLANLDKDKVPTFAAFLSDVCKRLKESGVALQIVAAVHILADSLAPYAEDVWEVEMVDGESRVALGQGELSA